MEQQRVVDEGDIDRTMLLQRGPRAPDGTAPAECRTVNSSAPGDPGAARNRNLSRCCLLICEPQRLYCTAA